MATELTYKFRVTTEKQLPSSPTDITPEFEETTEVIDYTYYHDTTIDDIVEYYSPKTENVREKELVKSAFNNIWKFLDIDAIEEDKDFIEYMKEKYRSVAYEKCQYENE